MTMESGRLGSATRERLLRAGLDPGAVELLVIAAVDEDLAGGIDVTTTATVPDDQVGEATFGARASGVIAGVPVVLAVLDVVCEGRHTAEVVVDDGARVVAGDILLRVRAPMRRLLTAERTALNFIGHLSGIATATSRWADALEGTRAVVRDTRKTTPGLRLLEKYAVRCGGGRNHRMSLSDAALVKDNHVIAAGGVAAAFTAVRQLAADIPVEIEVDDLDGLVEALEAGADVVLLDNFDVDMMRAAVDARDRIAPSAVLEASGGLTIDTATEVGRTGVDYIAVGELTHSARVLDIGLDVQAVFEA
jgi:nicotinate-nucleotide pyrophosphorylase (carboxylating)